MKATQDQIKLQAPGAGLPLSQKIAIKLWLGPFVSKRTAPADCRRMFEGLSHKIADRYRSIKPEMRDVKVLVDPIPGLEDSSRNWSANELLEHLMIVNTAAETVILTLAAGRRMNATVDIAKLKPRGQKPEDPIKEYEDYSFKLMERLDSELSKPGMNLHSTTTLHHPWFGPFTARQWYWLLGMHSGIHYKQIKEIARNLQKE